MKYLFIFLAFFFFSFNLFSEDEESKSKKNSHIYVGGGFVNKPTYLGSSSRRFFWFPIASFKYQDKDRNHFNSFEVLGPYANLSIVENNHFSLGLVGEYDFGRQRGDDNSLTLLEEIDPSYDIGINFEYKLPYNFSFGSSVATGITGFGDQIETDLSLGYTKSTWITFNQLFVNKTSLSYQYGNSDFMNQWFGTPKNEKYNLYKPGSDFYSLTLVNNLTSPITNKVSIVLNVDYQRLIGDAADSPLVEEHGSPNQYSFMFIGLFKLYGF